MQALAAGGGAVRLPIRKARLASKIREVRSDLAQEQQEEPSNELVEEVLNLQPGEVEEILRGLGAQASVNVDEESGDPLGLALSQSSGIPAADHDLIRHAFREEVERLLEHLTPRERQVIERRFGLGPDEPQTLEEVGRRLKLSRERVRQIEERAKQKLRATARTRQLKEFLN
jgi:RNA polymerase primary sigma factor